MAALPPSPVRDNLPLFAVGAILLLTFLALAVFGEGERDEASTVAVTVSGAPASSTAPPPLEALPANAKDSSVVWSRLGPDAARERNARREARARSEARTERRSDRRLAERREQAESQRF